MKKIVLFTFVIFMAGTLFPAKIVPMDEVLKPFAIIIHGDRILINEGPKIYIYSLKDFSLIKKLGERGEGPGEFKLNRGGQVELAVQSGNIIVSSDHRVSYFDMDGKYINERNFKLGDVNPIGKNFVGRKEINETDKKEWHDKLRLRYSFYPQIKDRIEFTTHFPAIQYVVYDDTPKKIYAITGKKENKKTECFIFDHKGKFLKRTLLELKSGKYTFHQGKLYQLVENYENENCELHISEIEGD